jgi:uncharacterized protein (TIGR03083 family)
MAASGIWSTIHAERLALADDLASLPAQRWDTPSLCPGWTVRDVLAHLTSTAKLTPLSFFAAFAGSGFRFNVMAARSIAKERGATAADGLAEFRRVADRTSSPPGPVDSWLGEVIVHGEDIRRPLGITRAYPMDALARVADFYKTSPRTASQAMGCRGPGGLAGLVHVLVARSRGSGGRRARSTVAGSCSAASSTAQAIDVTP